MASSARSRQARAFRSHGSTEGAKIIVVFGFGCDAGACANAGAASADVASMSAATATRDGACMRLGSMSFRVRLWLGAIDAARGQKFRAIPVTDGGNDG